MNSIYSFKVPRGTRQFKALADAINQGIDPRLNAVFFTLENTDGDFIDLGINTFKSLAVLMYRLWYAGQDNDDEESENWFYAICDTLGLEDPWLVDNPSKVIPEIYYGQYEKVGVQFVGDLDKVVQECLESGKAPTGVMMQV